jgi:hypothetical protein
MVVSTSAMNTYLRNAPSSIALCAIETHAQLPLSCKAFKNGSQPLDPCTIHPRLRRLLASDPHTPFPP